MHYADTTATRAHGFSPVDRLGAIRMSGALSDALAELIAMRASGEISPEEFAAARGRLRGDGGASSSAQLDNARPTPALIPTPTPRPVADAVTTGAAAASVPAKPKRSRLRHAFAIAVALLLTIVALASFGGKTTFKKEDYGSAWPYPAFESATIRCQVKIFGSTARPVATVELGGVTYGLNGPGLGQYPDPRPFEPTDKSETASTVSAMIQEALKLCRWKQ